MKYYQLNDWIVHPEQCEIVDIQQQNRIQLEPQLMKLLTYLVEHQDKVVSRDELAEAIWPGVVIEDNTISRAITRLRKTLNDDYRQPQYIKTLPKRGYRLVANISECDHQTSIDNTSETKHSEAKRPAGSRASNQLLFAILITLLVVIASLAMVFLKLNQSESKAVTSYDTKPLSSQTGREYSPSFSADGNYFVFVSNNQSESWLYLQQRGQDTAVPLVRLHDPNTKPQWSPVKDSVIYSEQLGDRCELILLEKVTSSSMTKRKLMTCQQETRLRPEWHQQNDAIYLIEENTANTGQNLVYFDIVSSQKEAIELPVSTKQLIYAKPSQDGQYLGILTSFFNRNSKVIVLDSHSKKIISEISLNYEIDDFAWHPDTDSILHVGEHPSHKIIRHFFDNTQVNVAASEIGYLDEVRSIGTSPNFAVTSLYLDRDLILLEKGNESNVIDSAYPDYSGVYSNNGQSLAFASKRSGRAQIWLQRNDASIYQLSQFKESYYIYDIVWSPDDQLLMVRANNQIYLFDVSNGRAQKLNINHDKPKLLGWYEPGKIYYISEQKNRSNLFSFELKAQTSLLLMENIDQAFYQRETQSWYYTPQQSNSLFRSKALPQQSQQAQKENLVFHSASTLVYWQVFENLLFVVEKDSQSDLETLTQVDADGNKRLILDRERIGYFNPLAQDKVLITKVTSNESNIIELVAQ